MSEINHEEAKELACGIQQTSNLARCYLALQQRLAELQQQSAMQQLEILRLMGALESIAFEAELKWIDEAVTEALSTPTTQDDLEEFTNKLMKEQLGEHVAYRFGDSQVVSWNEKCAGDKEFTPLYTLRKAE